MNAKPITIAIIASCVALIGCSQKPEDSSLHIPPTGRYKLYSSGSGQYPREFLLDTRTGRLWLYTADDAKNTMVMYPVTFESIDKQLSLIPNETATDITITKPTKTVTRFPTAEELEQLRKEGVDIEAIKGKKLVFPEGYETPTNIPLVNPFELDEGASKAEQRANHPK